MTTKYLPTADGSCCSAVKLAVANTPTGGGERGPPDAAVTPDTSATKLASESTKQQSASEQQQLQQPQKDTTKKKRTNVFRRRSRRRQREEPTLTRLAAVLGQIKEACMEEQVGPKVAPLIESATRMIEALSENQKQGGASRVKADVPEGEVESAKKAESNSQRPERKLVATSTTAAAPAAGGSGVVSGGGAAGASVVPGSKIPPHIYRPRMWNSVNQQEKTLPYINTNRLAQPVNKEAVQMDQMKLDIRSRLRKATSIEEFQNLAGEAERLGMTHEATAARNHIGKLKAAATPAA